jgi:hypothetical protein
MWILKSFSFLELSYKTFSESLAFMQSMLKLDSGRLPDLEKALAASGIMDLCGCTFSGKLAQSTSLVGSDTMLCNGTILLPSNISFRMLSFHLK